MRLALKTYGERAILAYDLSEKQRAGLCAALPAHKPEGCCEYVEGDNTVLFLFKEPISVRDLENWLRKIKLGNPRSSKARVIKVPIVYDGPDLKRVARQSGLSVEEVVGIHSSATYTVRMSGFTPGFPYLDGLDPRLHLPRKDSPRKRIAPGSVAIGGSHAGIYSVASPGGWHLLGRTDLVLFDPLAARGDAPDPKKVFFFSPGDRLRFQSVA